MSLTPPPPYCDCTLAGHRLELVPGSHLMLSGRRIELPLGQNILFPRLSPNGLSFAGIGHIDGKAWEWTGGFWFDRGPSEGPHAVIYDNDGTLHIVRETDGAPTGSQGWRYVGDLGLVAAFLTYADVHRGIYEYTERGDITVGQGGDEEGLQAIIRGRRVLLDSGIARFIRFYRAGDLLAIAYVRNHVEAKFLFLTVGDLDALPTYSVPVTPKPVPDTPTPVTPKPEPQPVSTPNHRHVVEQVATQFGHLLVTNTRAAVGEFTERAVLALAAVDPNWGHVKKQPGQTQWNGHAEDATMYRATQQVVDILYRAGAAELPPDHHDFGKPALIAWDHKDSGGQPWMAPIPVEGSEPEPDPKPEPKPEPQPVCSCAAEFAEIRAEISQLKLDTATARGDAAAAKGTADRVSDDLSGLLKSLAAGVTTSRAIGHSHVVKVGK